MKNDDKYIYKEHDVIFGSGYTRNHMVYQDGDGFLDSVVGAFGRVFSRKAVENLGTKAVEKIGENLTKTALQETAKKGLDLAVKSATDFAVDKSKELVKNKITEVSDNIFGKKEEKEKDDPMTREERDNLKRAILRIRKRRLERLKTIQEEEDDDEEDDEYYE